jgi:hypothetical protein
MPDETTDDMAQWLRALLKAQPRTAREVLSHLTADTTGPPDLVQGMMRMITTIVNETMPVEVVSVPPDADRSNLIEAFLADQPGWHRGVTRFDPVDLGGLELFTLDKGASGAFKAWRRVKGDAS